MAADPPKGPKTVTTVQRYDADGELVSEVTTVTIIATPQADAVADPGCYL